MRVIAPASTANLGPGFDSLGIGLELPFELATAGALGDEVTKFLAVEPGHPAFVAYRHAGGDPDVELWWRSPIPPGRGLGFSGAARVAGAFLATLVDRGSQASEDPDEPFVGECIDTAFRIATELEGHADNAAASAYGGFCVASADHALRVDPPGQLLEELTVITWSPQAGTSTRSARAKLPDTIAFSTAVSSISGSATWVAAMATGRVDVLRDACRDLLHQPHRLEARPDTAAFLNAALADTRVLAAWLSGSGPSVAVLVPTSDSELVASELGRAELGRAELGRAFDGGVIRALRIAVKGVRIS